MVLKRVRSTIIRRPATADSIAASAVEDVLTIAGVGSSDEAAVAAPDAAELLLLLHAVEAAAPPPELPRGATAEACKSDLLSLGVAAPAALGEVPGIDGGPTNRGAGARATGAGPCAPVTEGASRTEGAAATSVSLCPLSSCRCWRAAAERRTRRCRRDCSFMSLSMVIREFALGSVFVVKQRKTKRGRRGQTHQKREARPPTKEEEKADQAQEAYLCACARKEIGMQAVPVVGSTALSWVAVHAVNVARVRVRYVCVCVCVW